MEEAEKYLEEGVDLTVFDLSKITFEDLEQLVLDTYNDAYHRTVKKLTLTDVSQQREPLLAYHKHLDSFNDPTIYNASESMIDDYLANNCSPQIKKEEKRRENHLQKLTDQAQDLGLGYD